MPRYSDQQLEAEVLRQLKQHRGRQHAIGRWELVAKIYGTEAAMDQNDTNIYDRHIRAAVESLRKRGALICDMGDGAGRFLPETVDEYRAFRAKFGSSAYAIIETINEMDKAADAEFPDLKQPRLL